MEHKRIFDEILKRLSTYPFLLEGDIFSFEVYTMINTSLFSLWDILYSIQHSSNRFPGIKLTGNMPSLQENIEMCSSLTNCFYDNSPEKALSIVFESYSLLASRNFNSKEEDLENEVRKHIDDFYYQTQYTCPINRKKSLFGLFYLYIYIVLEEIELIEDDIKLWNQKLVDYVIYLPFEGTISIESFQFFFSPYSGKLSSPINFMNKRNEQGRKLLLSYSDIRENGISQYDCGFKAPGNVKISLKKSELIEILYILNNCNDQVLFNYDQNKNKNLLKIPLEWLALFHVCTNTTESNGCFKLIKTLKDVEVFWGEKNKKKISIYQILANANACNFNVRGIIYDDLYGNITICIKSILFRELDSKTIYLLEDKHDTIMDHLGNFIDALTPLFYDINVEEASDLKDFMIKSIQDFTGGLKQDPTVESNAIIQFVSWLFLSEIYSYLSTQLSILKYLDDNIDILKDSNGYNPNLISKSDIIHFKDFKSKYFNRRMSKNYRQHPIFNNSNINDLIDKTIKAILNFYADTYRFQDKKCLTLRQFMAVSLVIVKAEQGRFRKIPENKFYGYATKRLNVSRLLNTPIEQLALIDILIGSNLFDLQNQVFIDGSHIELRNKVITCACQKIIQYIELQLPILRIRDKNKAKKDDNLLKNKLTPSVLLDAVYDITVNLFDKLLDENPITKKESQGGEEK